MKKVLGIVIICLMFAGFVCYYKTCKPSSAIRDAVHKPVSLDSRQVLSFRNKELCYRVAEKTGLPPADILAMGYLADKTGGAGEGFAVIKYTPTNRTSFDKELLYARKQQYRICNIKSKKYHLLDCRYGSRTKNYVILPLREIKGYAPCGACCAGKGQTKKESQTGEKKAKQVSLPSPPLVFQSGYIKIVLSDHTTNLKPSKECSSYIGKEIVRGINSAQSTIDMALYGYERTPEIDRAIDSAINRGVKIRFVYDEDSKGGNLYSGTKYLAEKIPDSVSDSKIAGLMHNKFFIFDNQTVLTGSANISNTDMSGFNSNSIIIIKSASVAEIYRQEFEQMLSGKFHTTKERAQVKNDFILGDSRLAVYFSPKDSTVQNALIPIINSAKKYIYIPAFLITERDMTSALIGAKQRGVDVRVVIDAVSGRSQHTKHRLLRQNGIQVKTENYAGKLHSKSMIIDDKYVVIGSMNFSYSGNTKNDENLIVLQNRGAAVFYRNFFEYLWSRINDYWLSHDVAPESKYSIGSLSDGIDNDYDGMIDEK